jgi:restriction endonuclease/TIR domain-containing protein
MPDNRLMTGRHVYLSYAQEDSGTASEIARGLEQRGIAVRLDRADIAWGESWAAHARSAVETTDTFVLVVSQESSRHVGDWEEAAAALDRRGIDVVAVAVPPPVIQDLAGRPVLEYAGPSAGESLADRIELGAAIDFGSLSGDQFEALVAELLTRYGYDTVRAAERTAGGGSGYDLRAVHDSQDREETLVEVKAYRRSGRVSVNEIQRLAALVRERGAHGMLVTTGQLTSVARQVLDRINGAGAQLQVLDGPALRRMLVANPDIAQRHLAIPDPGTAPQ